MRVAGYATISKLVTRNLQPVTRTWNLEFET